MKVYNLFLLPLLTGCLVMTSYGQDISSSTLLQATELLKQRAHEDVKMICKDDWKMRAGDSVFSLTPKMPRIIQVTLFSGNQYCFMASAPPPALALKISIFDSTGHEVKSDVWKDHLTTPQARASVKFLATESGTYFVKLTLVKSHGMTSAECTLLYGYK